MIDEPQNYERAGPPTPRADPDYYAHLKPDPACRVPSRKAPRWPPEDAARVRQEVRSVLVNEFGMRPVGQLPLERHKRRSLWRRLINAIFGG